MSRWRLGWPRTERNEERLGACSAAQFFVQIVHGFHHWYEYGTVFDYHLGSCDDGAGVLTKDAAVAPIATWHQPFQFAVRENLEFCTRSKSASVFLAHQTIVRRGVREGFMKRQALHGSKAVTGSLVTVGQAIRICVEIACVFSTVSNTFLLVHWTAHPWILQFGTC